MSIWGRPCVSLGVRLQDNNLPLGLTTGLTGSLGASSGSSWSTITRKWNLSDLESYIIPHSTSSPLVLGCSGQGLVFRCHIQRERTVESVTQHYAPEQMFESWRWVCRTGDLSPSEVHATV